MTPEQIAFAYCENERHSGYPCLIEGCPHCGGKMSFEVYRKRGRGWQLLTTVNASSSLKAALRVQGTYGGKKFGVRPEYSHAKLFIHTVRGDT